ncbi:hypothetical protein GCM10007285_05840 [Stappia taiwanensis]|nr:hypothetical protein GCM10007285_05840 [Stappia taiwanensis]
MTHQLTLRQMEAGAGPVDPAEKSLLPPPRDLSTVGKFHDGAADKMKTAAHPGFVKCRVDCQRTALQRLKLSQIEKKPLSEAHRREAAMRSRHCKQLSALQVEGVKGRFTATAASTLTHAHLTMRLKMPLSSCTRHIPTRAFSRG